MKYKFEKLEVWKMAVANTDIIYKVASHLPNVELYNLKSQIKRAATSVCLNIAEGSTSQTNSEQARFINISLRSLIEVVACLKLIENRKYNIPDKLLNNAHQEYQLLFFKLQAFKNSLAKANKIKQN